VLVPLLLAVSTLALLGWVGPAAAQESPGEPISNAAQLPVQFGQPAVADARKWSEVGLAVPVLLGFTAVLLCVGAGLLVRSCRGRDTEPVI
jgi:hypothetical protein